MTSSFITSSSCDVEFLLDFFFGDFIPTVCSKDLMDSPSGIIVEYMKFPPIIPSIPPKKSNKFLFELEPAYLPIIISCK